VSGFVSNSTILVTRAGVMSTFNSIGGTLATWTGLPNGKLLSSLKIAFKVGGRHQRKR
jgi:hypothetical protein